MVLNILLTLVGALLGALLGLLLSEPHRLPSWLFLRNKTNLHGNWLCAWQCDPDNLDEWSYDQVELTRRFGKLNVHVLESSKDFNWATNLMIRGEYFIGPWHSRRPDSTACGTLTLRLSKQGNRFAGFWSGPTESRMMAGQVVIGKNESEVEEVRAKFMDYL